ncbi:hypothetical protein PoB_000944100 [Plakobranchus ocellatus]|uniref:Uncharacterized protein n=1 Tax=Plakobranchus ocellatus TaxID=259542 RepID=A0AAV3YI75_9GAST|nr:hypothetical protein PoB_000944100 [Plakobranchus ocellatus]
MSVQDKLPDDDDDGDDDDDYESIMVSVGIEDFFELWCVWGSKENVFVSTVTTTATSSSLRALGANKIIAAP